MPQYELNMPFYFYKLQFAIAFEKKRIHRKGRMLNVMTLGLYWDTGMPHSFLRRRMQPGNVRDDRFTIVRRGEIFSGLFFFGAANLSDHDD